MRLARNHGCIKEVCFADKFCDKSCGRLFVNFIRTTDLQHFSLIHHRNAVGYGKSLALVMGNKNKGNTDLIVQFIKFNEKISPQLCVKCRKRFIQEQYPRFVNQCASNCNSLLLPPGKLRRLFVDMRIKLYQMQIFFNSPINFVLRAFANSKRKSNVFVH